MRFVVSCLVTLLSLGTTASFAATPEPTTDEQKTLYAMGLSISQSIGTFGLSEPELDLLKSGITDGVLKKTPKVDLQTFGPKIQQLQEARALVIAEPEKKAGAAFLAKVAAESGAKKTESGAILKTLKEGNGAIPKVSDMVKVHYQGTLIDGTVFDDSAKQGGPVTLRMNEMSKCWVEGMQQIKVGSKSKLVCPSSLAYRDKGRPPLIKPGATLVFEIELLEIIANQVVPH
ncbi:MAG: FKBP-type peptidyl-prolyl cis-trans isomerase [Nitrospirota bacterium]|jgi:FKBP-type peptidyl-prolyl cis-trans isomerase FkpA/FKBP-type peptidyl-prolyl cis-trans isomerase FklB